MRKYSPPACGQVNGTRVTAREGVDVNVVVLICTDPFVRYIIPVKSGLLWSY